MQLIIFLILFTISNHPQIGSFQDMTEKNEQILTALKDQFKCFQTNDGDVSQDQRVSLYSWISLLNKENNEGAVFESELESMLGNKDYRYYRDLLRDVVGSYWSIEIKSSGCEAEPREFTSKISKPIYNEDSTKAVVLGYRVTGYNDHSILLFSQINGTWKYDSFIKAGSYLDRKRKQY